GSPEAVAEVCMSSTLPLHFQATVHNYAKQGLYCMGLATKQLAQQRGGLQRSHVEADLTFVGLLLFTVRWLLKYNPIKPDSPALIGALEAADIDVRMITGDNALTAIHGITSPFSSNL
ncbi:hypothetical protein AaE_000699, partial [Aphanomyces astaci]